MKKRLLAIIAAGFLAANIYAGDTKRTELVMRDQRNLAASVTTYNRLIPDEKALEDKIATKWQVTGFYKETQRTKRLGEVFGANGKNWIKVGNSQDVATNDANVENNLLLHFMHTGIDGTITTSNTLAGKIQFNPRLTAYGTRLDTHICLDNIVKGLYFKNNIVCTHIKHNLGAAYLDLTSGATTGGTGAPSPYDSINTETAASETIYLNQLFNGTSLTRSYSLKDQQDPLHFAKMGGPSSRTGIENIESELGIKLLDKENAHFAINMALLIPTGDRPLGEYLWEPRLGNNHWAFGGGFEAFGRLWNNTDEYLNVFARLNYRYQFEATEKRTLGIKGIFADQYYNRHILSHYYILGYNGRKGLFPAANVLTKDVSVKPGSMIDAALDFSYKHKKFCFDLGYNLYWKDSENVSLKEGSWTDNIIGIAHQSYNANTAFSSSWLKPGTSWINYTNIDTTVAESPEILSHTFFGGLGYMMKLFDNPFMLGAGASYEYGYDRAAADAFTFWGKFGMAF